MPSCDHLYACDYRWWKHHIADITNDYEGVCWTQDVQWEVDPAQWGINKLTSLRKPGLSTEPGVIHQGQNSGYQAVNLAYHRGAKRIILLGFDMRVEGDKRHWFGAHPDKLEAASPYADFIRNFGTIDCKALGIEIWNVTRRTALTCFPLYDLDDVHESLLQPGN